MPKEVGIADAVVTWRERPESGRRQPSYSPDEVSQRTGRPFNKAMSSRIDWRFGRHGSLSINPRDGVWFDHETGQGGLLAGLMGEPQELRPRRNPDRPLRLPKKRWSPEAEMLWSGAK